MGSVAHRGASLSESYLGAHKVSKGERVDGRLLGARDVLVHQDGQSNRVGLLAVERPLALLTRLGVDVRVGDRLALDFGEAAHDVLGLDDLIVIGVEGLRKELGRQGRAHAELGEALLLVHHHLPMRLKHRRVAVWQHVEGDGVGDGGADAEEDEGGDEGVEHVLPVEDVHAACRLEVEDDALLVAVHVVEGLCGGGRRSGDVLVS